MCDIIVQISINLIWITLIILISSIFIIPGSSIFVYLFLGSKEIFNSELLTLLLKFAVAGLFYLIISLILIFLAIVIIRISFSNIELIKRMHNSHYFDLSNSILLLKRMSYSLACLLLALLINWYYDIVVIEFFLSIYICWVLGFITSTFLSNLLIEELDDTQLKNYIFAKSVINSLLFYSTYYLIKTIILYYLLLFRMNWKWHNKAMMIIIHILIISHLLSLVLLIISLSKIDSGVFKSIFSNWSIKPIKKYENSEICNRKEDRLLEITWRGTKQGCYCKDEIIFNSCEVGNKNCNTIDSIEDKVLFKYNNMILCGERIQYDYFSLSKSNNTSIISYDENCNEDQYECGIIDNMKNKLCVDGLTNQNCPLIGNQHEMFSENDSNIILNIFVSLKNKCNETEITTNTESYYLDKTQDISTESCLNNTYQLNQISLYSYLQENDMIEKYLSLPKFLG